MSAELLRRAAAGIRQDATESPDHIVTDNRVNGVWLNSAYYLTTTPDFLLAVADWLETTAERINTPAQATYPQLNAALAVARAYLGEQS